MAKTNISFQFIIFAKATNMLLKKYMHFKKTTIRAHIIISITIPHNQ